MQDQELIFNKPFIAFDRSQDSEKMLQMYQTMKDKLTSTTLLHVHNPLKGIIIFAANRGPQIRAYLEQKYQKDPKVKILLKEIQDNDKTINEIILQTYLGEKSNIIWFGFTGNKGRKPRNQQLSSRIRQYIYDSKNDLAIIKCSPKRTNKVIFCCDGSQISIEGLKKAILFSKMHGYFLTIFHATNSDLRKYSKQLKANLKNLLAKQKNIENQIIVQQIPLLEYLVKESYQFEWTIITKNGYRGEISNKFFVGSNSSDIITNVETNIILIN